MNALLRPRLLLVLLCLTALVYAPVLSVMVADGTAGALGCRLSEADAHPCFLLGLDIGDVLYGLFVIGWLMLATWPLMLATPVAWILVAILMLLRAWRRSRSTAASPTNGNVSRTESGRGSETEVS